MKNIIILSAALCCAFVSGADTTISWPSDFQDKLAARISESVPDSAVGVGKSDVVSFSSVSSVSSAYGTQASTFESVWQSVSVSGGFSGFSFGMPGFWIFLR